VTPERWQRVRDVLHEAMQLKPEERPAYLGRWCADDDDLRQQISELLEAEEGLTTDFLESLPQAETALDRLTVLAASKSELATSKEPLVGRRVGSYRIVEEIGSGGMGEVYRAFRADDQYRKEVAVKVVRQGQNSGAVVARVTPERQILADLDHPNIALLHDGGTTEAGDPFFVMELIEGLPIDEYCDQRKLSISERLELFCHVCSAVEYAHRHLIVHRDIKPSNILVTGEGVPKLLDFGIAKILGEPAIDRPETTLTMFRALTPGYASPEQVTGATITTATDVYSLGVVLYELLTGRSPYRLSTRTTAEMVRAVCDVEPEKLSLAVRPDGHPDGKVAARNAQEIAVARQSSPEKLSKRLRGDLDNIVLMALRKEPQRRYASAEQFAQDIRWNLTSLPVIARKDTLGYRTAKFVNRHRAGVLAGAAVFLTLVLGIAVTLREAQIARAHQARAERNFNDVRALANSLIFDVHDNIQDLPGATKARKVLLDRALQYLDRLAQEAAGDAGLQRELAAGYERLGDVQGKPLDASLGDTDGALKSYNKALRLRQTLLVNGDANAQDLIALARAYRLIANEEVLTTEVSGAFEHAKKAVAASLSASNLNAKGNQAAASELAWDYLLVGTIESGGGFNSSGLSNPSAALEDFGKALEINTKLLKTDPENASLVGQEFVLYERIGGLQGMTGRRAEGLQNLDVALNIVRRLVTKGDNPLSQRRLGAIASLKGITLLMDGQFDLALANFREELRVAQQLAKHDPHDQNARGYLVYAYHDMAVALMRLRKFHEALTNVRQAIAIVKDLIASDPKQIVTQSDLAMCRVTEADIMRGMHDEAAALQNYKEARGLYDRLAQTDQRNLDARLNVAATDAKIAATFLRLGQYDEAQKSYRRAIQVSEPPANGTPPNLEAQYTLANAYSGLGDVAFHLARSTDPKLAALKEATSWYEKSIGVWNKIPSRGVMSPAGFDVGDLEEVADHLARCKAILEKLQGFTRRAG
jgi:serine/threonine protein kinase/tetratricopeptide (TPR) repeat protein